MTQGVPVCQLLFGLLPFVYFRPNGVRLLLSMIEGNKKSKTIEAVTATKPILNRAFIAYWMKRQGTI